MTASTLSRTTFAASLLMLLALAGCAGAGRDQTKVSPFQGAGSVPLDMERAGPSSVPMKVSPENVWPVPVQLSPPVTAATNDQPRTVVPPPPEHGTTHKVGPGSHSEVEFQPSAPAETDGTATSDTGADTGGSGGGPAQDNSSGIPASAPQ